MPAGRIAPAAERANVRGTVFDSLTLTPLGGARLTFRATDPATISPVQTTADANGSFAVTLKDGSYLATFGHPRLDSLRLQLPAQPIVVPARARSGLRLSTPSSPNLTRSLCGGGARNDDLVVVGTVRNAATDKGVGGAKVSLKWSVLTLTWTGYSRTTESQVATTADDGWYFVCGAPSDGSLLAWAERGGATTGAVLLTLTRAPQRLDLTLDTTSVRAMGSVDLEPDSNGVSLFPTSTGHIRYRVIVRDLNGRALGSARARLLGRNTVRTDDAGTATFDSVASGTQMLEVLAVGHQPERRIVTIAPSGQPVDTVVLAPLATMLGTVRITSGRDPIGWELRRSAGRGQFITADDIVRENPVNTTRLLRTRDGLRYTFDRNGFPRIEMTTGPYKACQPLVLIDGFPPGPAPAAPGQAILDWIIQPDEIGGVEIYNSPAQVPAEIARFAYGPVCGAIVFWTRDRLGLPKALPRQP